RDRGLRGHVDGHPRRQTIDRGLRGDAADRELAVPGARGRAVAGVAKVAGADDRRVADAARVLVRPPARAHRGGDIAAPIEGEEVHGPSLFLDGLPHDGEQPGTTAHAGRRLARLAEALDPELAGRGGEVLCAVCTDL